ncbi:MAG: hypothetical protein K8J08_19120, partial [Thermoanaerobaculia bacterium]|nr:hypothetical protein [Thermoanaerobaculia bacterium]
TGPSVSIDYVDAQEPTRLGPRRQTDDARLTITTKDGAATLLLTDDEVALQLTDRTLAEVRRDNDRDARDDDQGILAAAIEAAARSGLESILSHSLECPLRALDDVTYSEGELVFTTADGEIFRNVLINDREVTRNFSHRDARAFVRAFQRAKAQQKARI